LIKNKGLASEFGILYVEAKRNSLKVMGAFFEAGKSISNIKQSGQGYFPAKYKKNIVKQ
jgi:hypothetical protein